MAHKGDHRADAEHGTKRNADMAQISERVRLFRQQQVQRTKNAERRVDCKEKS